MSRNLEKDLEICNRATSGPWVMEETQTQIPIRTCDPRQTRGYRTICYMGSSVKGNSKNPVNIENIKQRRIDAEFITAAREGWKEAINRALTAEAELRDIKESNAKWEYIGDVLGWIKSQCKQEFTKRDVYCSMHNQFKKANDADPILNILIGHGYIKEVESKRKDQRIFQVLEKEV